MPTIDATLFVDRSYVLVEVDWADVPAATCVQVLRVRVDTGEETPLRPYVAPCSEFGEFQELSGGRAVFWDTEAPLDTAFFYRTVAAGVDFVENEIRDSFTRTNTDTWNNTDSGHTWGNEGGAATDYDVAAGVGTMSLGAVNNSRRSLIQGTIIDSDQMITAVVPVTATGATILMSLMSRYADNSNLYRANIVYNTNNSLDLTLVRTLAGANTNLDSAIGVGTYAPNDRIRIRFETRGSNLRAKVWMEADPEPAAFQVDATDTTFISGMLGPRGILTAGNTNALPVIVSWDNYFVDTTFMTLETEPMIMPSNGYFWLKDPVRPCNDQRLTTQKMLDPDCPPGRGIFFLALDTESYAPNSTLALPTNAKRPLLISRTRRDAATALALVTRSFTDRDAVLALNEPGSPLLFLAAPNYGIPDRYMAIGAVQVTRGLPDHRYAPRVINLPYDTVDRPVGTTQGICGSRFMDLCDTFDTWQEMVDAGLTYSNLVEGAASEPDEGFNSWDDIEAGFADWDAVEAAFPTWGDVAGGP